MQIPILNGIYVDTAPDVRVSYPVNYMPVPKQNGISNGYLRPVDGLEQFAVGEGADRGGINWRDECYRVSGSKLIKVLANGTTSVLGDVGAGGQASFAYSFDKLAVASNNNLFYWDGSVFQQVTDPDLGICLDVIFIDGYFMTTDGEFLVVTELNNPLAVDPLKYGSSEADPDPVVGLLEIKNEAYAINRYTIEVFSNVGGDNFPFQRIDGAQIQRGAIGRKAFCMLDDAVAFLGSGRNEAPSVYLGANSQSVPLSTQEIDLLLSNYSEVELSQSILEVRVFNRHQHLWVRLPDRTLVYDLEASKQLQEPVWFVMTSSITGFAAYKAANLVYCYDRWIAGDPLSSMISTLVPTHSKQFGENMRWEFSTGILYNEGFGGIIYELELVALTGSIDPADGDPQIYTCYSVDGVTWSVVRPITAGKRGVRAKRLVWLQQGMMNNWRIQKFAGDSRAHLSVLRLEAKLEGLAV